MAQKKKLSGMLSGATAIPRAEITKKEPKKLSGMLTYYTPTQNRGGLAGGLEYLGASVLAGAGGVLEGTFDLIGGGIAQLTGDNAYAEYLHNNNVVGEWKRRYDTAYNPGKGMSFAGDVAQGIGQNTAYLLNFAVPGLGTAVFSAGMAGGAVSEAYGKTGELGLREYLYGAGVGALEGIMGKTLSVGGQLVGNVTGKMGSTLVSKLTPSVLKKWASTAAWKGVVKNAVTGAGGEFLEEFLSEYATTALQRVTGVDKDATTTLNQALYAGLVGAASGAALGGASSAIGAAYAYRSGKNVVEGGNVDALINTSQNLLNNLNVKDGDKITPEVNDLRKNLETWKNLEDKSSSGAIILLGHMKADVAMIQMYRGVQAESARLSTVNEAQATAYAKAMSYFDGNAEVSKNYTAQDWFNNKNDIRTRYAAMGWAGAFLSDSRAEVETAAFNQAIAADMAGRAVGKPTVADIAGAEWDGSDATFYVGDANRGEGAPSEGDYLRIAKDAKGGYYMAVGNNAEGARGFAGRTENEVRELFNGYRDAIVQGRTKRATEAEISARAAGAQTVEEQNIEGEASPAVSPETALRDEINAGSGRIAENRYTQAQTDAARKAVKNFDMLDADTKAKILRWVESTEGKGVDADVVSAVASIMRIREGLQVIYADTKEGVAGFHDEIKKADRNLIVLSSRNDLDLLRETIAHELGHEVENAEGFEEIKKAALKATKEADLKEWEEFYKKKFPNMTPEEARAEAEMKALGRRLATPQFLNRYANRSTLRRLVDAGKQLIEYLRADEAGKLAIDETNKLIEMMDRAIMGVSQNAEKGKSGTKYNSSEITRNVIDLSTDDKLSALVKNVHGSERYNIIKNYILSELADQPIKLSDGKNAIVDKSDAQHIARNAGDKKAAEISHIKKIIENAQLVAEESSKKDTKFDYYWYYEANVSYEGETMPIYVNVGRARNDALYHIYDITQKLRDTAHRVNDVERPVGNALENGIPTNSISQTTEKSTPSAKKTYNLTESEAERAAQDAAEVEAFRNQQDDKAREDAEKALFDAEVIRTETIARDTNSTYFKWADVNRDIKSLAKSYGIVGREARDIAFAVHRAFNGFKAIQHRQEKRDNMIYSLVDLMIERADAAENKAGRWSDERRDQLYKRLNEIFDNNAKKTERQKARERVENAEELAWRAVNGSAIAPLLDRVKLRRFREKTKGVLSEGQWKDLVKLAQRIRPKYSVNLDNAAEFLRAFYDFAAKFASEAVVLAEDPGSEAKRQLYNDARNGNEVLRYVDARLAGMLKDFSEREGGEWTDSDYETLRLALERLLALDGRFDKQFNTDGTFGETKDVADEVVSSLDRKYKGKVSSVNVGGFSGVFHTLVYNSLEPESAVRLLEGARGKHILSRMVNSIKYAAEFAKNDERKWMREIEDFKTKNKEWWKKWNEGDVTLTFTLPTFGGKTKSSQTLLTKDEAASYYMTTKRLQAQAALALGRVEIADALDRKGEQYRSRVIDGLTDEQIDEILTMKQVERDAFLMQCVNSMKAARNELYKQFSDLDRQYIALIENFYSTTSKTEKRNMDTRLYGSTNVFDGYYYPISRSSLNRDMDLSSTFHDLDDVSTRGYTFNKSTINGARSRLTIRGASEVTSRHARQLAMYKHLTMPLQNLQRMYNYRFNKKVAGAETVREYLNKYVWKGTEKYLSDYFKDVQGMSRRTANDAASQAFRHLQSGYVKFQLGANLKSLIKQFGSAVGMTSVVDLDVWAKGIYSAKIFSKEATADMKKYSKFAENRIDSNEVYYAANVSGKVGKVSDVLMKHLEWGDTRANLIMWAMAQEAVAKETNHAVGTVENKRLAGKKLDEFIMTVQDTSGAATKSAYARSPQVLVQGFTLFSSAPTKLASRLIVAATELRELRQLKNEGGISDTEMKKLEELEGKTKKVLGKVGGAVLMVALFEALVNIGWGKLGNDDEEDEKFVQTLATEVVSNAVGIIPLAGGFAESLISGYDVSNLYLDVYNDGIASIRNLYTMTANLASGEQVSQQTVLKNLRSVAYFSGQVTGIPIRNINNLITRTLGVVSNTAAYEYDALFYEPSYSSDLKKAMEKGDEKLVESIVGLTLRERTGAASSFASDEVVRLTLAGHNAMPRAIPTTVNVDGEDRNVTRRERAAFEKIYSGADPMVIALMATEQYTELSDELRAKAIKVTYDIYHSRAKSEVFGAELSTMAALSYFEDYIDVPTLVAESAYIYGIKGTADAKRSEIVKAYISGYSPEAQAILLYAAGYRSEAVKEVISGLYGRLDADAQKSLKNIFDF